MSNEKRKLKKSIYKIPRMKSHLQCLPASVEEYAKKISLIKDGWTAAEQKKINKIFKPYGIEVFIKGTLRNQLKIFFT